MPFRREFDVFGLLHFLHLTAKAFAYQRSNGSVLTWGHESCGGSSKGVRDQLVDVEQILGARPGSMIGPIFHDTILLSIA